MAIIMLLITLCACLKLDFSALVGYSYRLGLPSAKKLVIFGFKHNLSVREINYRNKKILFQ